MNAIIFINIWLKPIWYHHEFLFVNRVIFRVSKSKIQSSTSHQKNANFEHIYDYIVVRLPIQPIKIWIIIFSVVSSN